MSVRCKSMAERTSSRFSSWPVRKLSSTTTWRAPPRSRPRTMAEPMKPAPPVTTYLLIGFPDGAMTRGRWFRRPEAVIAAMLAYALNSQGAEFAGWTVGMLSAEGLPTILRSTDSGASWTRQGTNGQVVTVPMYGVTAVDTQTAWVVGESDGYYATIYHTTDGGLTWNRMGSAAQVPDVGLQKVTTFGDNSIWAVGIGVILHSSDGGATWTNQIPTDYTNIQFQAVATPDGVNVWVAGNEAGGYATILKSGDGGTSWTRQSGSTNDVQLLDHILDMSAVNPNTAWAIGGVNTSLGWYVLGTTNGGVTWTQQNKGTYDGNGIHAVDASTIWAVSDNNTTWSTNGGATWTETNSPFNTMGISAVNAQQAWAVSAAQSGAIQWTTNGGLTWMMQIG